MEEISVLDLFWRTVQEHPDSTAVVDSHSSATFEDLLRSGAGVAELIPSMPEPQPVLILIDKSVEAVVGIVGVLLSGNIYCPVDVMSPSFRLQAVIDNLGPVAILTTAKRAQALAGLDLGGASIVRVEDTRPEVEPPLDELIARTRENTSNRIDLDPAYVIYTSGSTGTPKGVTVSHRGIIDYINWARDCFSVTHEDTIASQAPLHFDNSTLDLYLCLGAGACLRLLPESTFAFPARLIDHLRSSGTTVVFWVPSVLVNVANRAALDGVELPDLRWVLFAGEVMPAKQLAYWMRSLPSARFANLYGPTEITVDCTYHVLEEVPADGESVPIGRACRNSDVLVLADGDREAKPGEAGELCVRGAGVALGYWNAPEISASVFVQNPLNTRFHDRIYRTGDLVRTSEDGLIYYLGRKDHQIKHMGYRIELGDIESAAHSVNGMDRCCALYDHDAQMITLFVESANLDVATLRRELLARLPKYMVPAKYHSVPVLPLTTNGKIDRKALEAQLTSRGNDANT